MQKEIGFWLQKLHQLFPFHFSFCALKICTAGCGKLLMHGHHFEITQAQCVGLKQQHIFFIFFNI